MASRTLANLALKAFWAFGETAYNDEMDANFLLLSKLVQAGAVSKEAATPGVPTNGELYIFDETHPTQANDLAIYDDDAWTYVTPQEGWLVYNRDLDYFEKFDGTVWAEFVSASGGSPPIGIVNQVDSYTPVLSDLDKYIRIDKATAANLTIPANGAVPYPIGTRLYIEQTGVGVVTIVGDAGVTVNSRGDVFDTAGQYAVAVAIQVETDLWTLSGDLA